MGEGTSIAWAHHTFNPWWGCKKVSPGCTNCYAEAFDRRLGGHSWTGAHRFFGAKHWDEPAKWNARRLKALSEAKLDRRNESPARQRVFCASMADVFEDARGLDAERRRLWKLIEETNALDWLLLTKRPENIPAMFPWASTGRANVWLGTSVEDQVRADERIPLLLAVNAPVRFLSCEPLLEQVDLVLQTTGGLPVNKHGIDWVIVGGESGPKSRPCDIEAVRSLVGQCREAQVPVFVKQLGARPTVAEEAAGDHPWAQPRRVIRLKDAKGADPSEWPEDLRVQETPSSAEAGRFRS